MPDPDLDDGPLDARKACLIDVLEDVGRKTLGFLYDFGDGWDHTVKIECITEAVWSAPLGVDRLVEMD